MRTKLWSAIMSLVVLAIAACGSSTSLETRTFDLDYLEPAAAYEIAQPYVFEDRPESPGRITVSYEARTLTVRETRDNLDRIARVLSERDLPRPGVELRFKVIEAGPDSSQADPAIADIEAALRDVFRFRGYRLVGEAVVRAADRSEIRQMIAGPAAHSINGTLSAVRAEEGSAATARLSITFWTDPQTPALETTVNLVDRQTIVLGTAGARGDDSAIILAVLPIFER